MKTNYVSIFAPLRDIRVAAGQPVNPNSDFLRAEATLPDLTYSQRPVLDPNDESVKALEQAAYEKGLAEAEARLQGEIEKLRQQLKDSKEGQIARLNETMVKSVQTQFVDVARSLEKQLVRLAGEAAVRIIAGMPICTDMVEAYIREAINSVEQDTEVTIVLNPEDYALLDQEKSTFFNRGSATPAITFRTDAKVGRGGCMIETSFGEIDARRETRVDLLQRAVNE